MKLQTLTKKALPFAIAGCAVVSLPAIADDDQNEYDDQCEWIEEIFEDESGFPFMEEYDDYGHGHDDNGYDVYDRVQSFLGLSDTDFEDALASGQSIADIATGQGVDLSNLIAEMVEEERALLETLVADGSMTGEELQTSLDEFAAMLNFEMNHVPFDPITWFAQTLSLTEDAFWEELDKGLTLNDIVTNAGLSASWVVESLIDQLTAEDQALVDAGLVEADEAATQSSVFNALIPALFELNADALMSLIEDEDEMFFEGDDFECEELYDEEPQVESNEDA